jgi:hypothetical protein
MNFNFHMRNVDLNVVISVKRNRVFSDLILLFLLRATPVILIVLLTVSCGDQKEGSSSVPSEDSNLVLNDKVVSDTAKAQDNKVMSERYRNFQEFFSFNDSQEKELYEDSYYKKLSKPDSIISSESYKNIAKKWIEVYSDSGQFYFYHKCEFIRRWELTDSAFVNYFTDGPTPEIIREISRNGDDYKIRTDNSLLEFKLINKARMVYKFNYGGSDFYISPIDQVATLPVFNEECPEY